MNPFRGLEDFFGELCTSQMCSAQMCQHPLSSKRESSDSYQRKSYQGTPQSKFNFKRAETPPGYPSVRSEAMASIKPHDNFKVFTYKTENGKLETFSLAVLQEDGCDSKRTLRSTGVDNSSDSVEPNVTGMKGVSKDTPSLSTSRIDRNSGSVKVTLNKRLQDIKSWRNTVAAVIVRIL